MVFIICVGWNGWSVAVNNLVIILLKIHEERWSLVQIFKKMKYSYRSWANNNNNNNVIDQRIWTLYLTLSWAWTWRRAMLCCSPRNGPPCTQDTPVCSRPLTSVLFVVCAVWWCQCCICCAQLDLFRKVLNVCHCPTLFHFRIVFGDRRCIRLLFFFLCSLPCYIDRAAVTMSACPFVGCPELLLCLQVDVPFILPLIPACPGKYIHFMEINSFSLASHSRRILLYALWIC